MLDAIEMYSNVWYVSIYHMARYELVLMHLPCRTATDVCCKFIVCIVFDVSGTTTDPSHRSHMVHWNREHIKGRVFVWFSVWSSRSLLCCKPSQMTSMKRHMHWHSGIYYIYVYMHALGAHMLCTVSALSHIDWWCGMESRARWNSGIVMSDTLLFCCTYCPGFST